MNARSKAEVLQSIHDGSLLQTARHIPLEDKILDRLEHDFLQILARPSPSTAATTPEPDLAESDRGYDSHRYQGD